MCKQFLLSGVHNEPGIFFAFCTNRLRREISTPKASHDSFAVMNKGKRPEKLFSKTFLAFKSPFHQDFLATSRITFLAVNSQKVVIGSSSTKRSHLTKKGKNEAHHWIVISFRFEWVVGMREMVAYANISDCVILSKENRNSDLYYICMLEILK